MHTGAASGLGLALLFALGAGACGSPEGRASEALLELEQVAFVPPGQLSLLLGREWISIDVREPLLVDMFEVTRGEWLRFERARALPMASELALQVEAWDESTADWPATYMTQLEAGEFAHWRGMRLLSAREWLYCALGPQRLPFPWGSTDQLSIANTLELGLERLSPVGTFEAGRSPQCIYDLLGNAAEWVVDLAPLRERSPGDARVSAMGGSFRNHSRPIFNPRPPDGEDELAARALPPTSRADDVGFRTGVEAATYLWSHAPAIDDSPEVRRRLVAIGRRWGRRAAPLLEELAARQGAPAALAALAEGARP